jgi:hypothetical protein
MNKKSISNPYINEDDSPTLRSSVVAFVDILGYTELCRNEPTSMDLLTRLRDALRNSVRSLYPDTGAQTGSQRFWMVKTFTDSIVIGFPTSFQNGASELVIILGRLGEFQLQMTQSGFFVRGGVSVGKLYMDDQIVFGPALIEAHDAEHKLARDPRIVLAKSAREMSYENKLADDTKGIQHQHDFLFKDSDEQLFLNYLFGVVAFEVDMGYPSIDYLQHHRSIIEERLGLFTLKPKIWAKYYWCAMYHNFFCKDRDDFIDVQIDMDTFNPKPCRVFGS